LPPWCSLHFCASEMSKSLATFNAARSEIMDQNTCRK
jgi:hypothetical protein